MCFASPVHSVDIVWVQNFVEITLSHIVSEINALLHFTQKFKMAAKSGGKAFCKKVPIDSADILGVQNLSKSLYLAPFPR